MDLGEELTQSKKSPTCWFISIVHRKPGDKKIPGVNLALKTTPKEYRSDQEHDNVADRLTPACRVLLQLPQAEREHFLVKYLKMKPFSLKLRERQTWQSLL